MEKYMINFLTIFTVTCILVIGGFFVWLFWKNGPSEYIVGITLPVLGAVLFAGYVGVTKVWLEHPDEFKKSFNVVNLEYSKGHIIPIQNVFTSFPLKIKEIDLWTDYLSRWRRVFSDFREPYMDLDPKFKSNDKVFFQFFEYFILIKLSDRFGYGWNHDESRMAITPFGQGGNISHGVQEKYVTKIDLKNKIKTNNLFLNNDKINLQLAMPVGTELEVKENEMSLELIFKNPRFNAIISFYMTANNFTPGERKDFFLPFYEKLQSKFGQYNPDKKIENMEERIFRFDFSYEQNRFNRFSDLGKYDSKFIRAISDYFYQMSWGKIGPIIEEIVNK